MLLGASCIFWIIISSAVLPLLLPTTNYRVVAAVVLIYDPYSSAIKRDLYDATITFTLDTGPPVYFTGDSFNAARRNQCESITAARTRFIHFICISSRASVLLYLLRNTTFILFVLRMLFTTQLDNASRGRLLKSSFNDNEKSAENAFRKFASKRCLYILRST